MHSDHRRYLKYSSHSRLDKALNSLAGIVEGITIDAEINRQERHFLEAWLEDHQEVKGTHPFNELFPAIGAALSDGLLADEEKRDILWLCEKLRSSEFTDLIAADMQRLHAILGGISADGIVSQIELRGLSEWISKHEHLKTLWPYDEIDSLVTSVLKDRVIDAAEHALLLNFFQEFTAILDDRTITTPLVSDGTRLAGLCSVCPDIAFDGSTFCFTGASSKYTRAVFSDIVRSYGGIVLTNVSPKLDYLIIGADGNPCWMYACYGRKVEKAVDLRKSGARIMLVHENDFHDAVEDR